MCGIGGMVTRGGAAPPDAALDAFAAALAHRGPDGTGRYSAPGIGMVQTRLAIIDLETGDQPLYGPEKNALIANGEIYNYLELRANYAAAQFITASDCEVPLHAFVREGLRFTGALRGMYAIALHDSRQDTLYLTRDPFGIKPLYYAETDVGLLFASEPEAILRSGLVARGIDTSSANTLLQLQFTTGRQTIYSGISRVLPGETVTVHDGRIAGREYRSPLADGPPRDIAEDDALAQLDAALMDSVLVHQRADVPYGMFLSGGIDSSALLACMARLNERPVRAFTAGFPGTSARDERAHAARVAKAAGAEHVEIAVTEEDFWTALPAIAACMDDPAADYAVLPTYLLAREAATELKVVLSGEGGDEILAGYGRYRSATRARLLGGRRMRRRGAFAGLGVLRDTTSAWRDGIAAAEKAAGTHGWSRLQRAQGVDFADWLPNDLLLKLDRCLMAHGLEGRTPFLDTAFAAFAFALPDTLKLHEGTGKYLLRRWLAEALPEADPFSKKRGFTVPVGEWIRARASALGPLIATNAGVEALCRPGKVAALFDAFAARGGKREAQACWHLLFYALWHRVHGEGHAPAGDVFAMLEPR